MFRSHADPTRVVISRYRPLRTVGGGLAILVFVGLATVLPPLASGGVETFMTESRHGLAWALTLLVGGPVLVLGAVWQLGAIALGRLEAVVATDAEIVFRGPWNVRFRREEISDIDASSQGVVRIVRRDGRTRPFGVALLEDSPESLRRKLMTVLGREP